MNKTKKLFSLLLACLLVGGATTIASETAVSAETPVAQAVEDLVLPTSDFANSANALYVGDSLTVNKTGGHSATDPREADNTGVIRIGLGDMDLSSATKFNFTISLPEQNGVRIGFIDSDGTACMPHREDATVAVSAVNQSTQAVTNPVVNYLGIHVAGGTQRVEVDKQNLTNRQAEKTGSGVYWWYGYSNQDFGVAANNTPAAEANAAAAAAFNWEAVDSMFIEIYTGGNQMSKGMVSFYNANAIDGSGVVTEIANAKDLTIIEKPAYKGETTAAGYEKNQVSFGSRPMFEGKNPYFKDFQKASAGYWTNGLNNEYISLVPTTSARNLSAYQALAYDIDTTAFTDPTGATQSVKLVMKDSGNQNYINNGGGWRIDATTQKIEWVAEKCYEIPKGFKGKLIIPFSSFWIDDTDQLYSNANRSSGGRTLLCWSSNGAKGILQISNVTYVADYTAASLSALGIADEVAAFEASYTMRDAASCRIKADDWGLRFQVNVDKTAYEALVAALPEGASVELGAILSDASVLEGDLTMDKAQAKSVREVWKTENELFYATVMGDYLQGKLNTEFTVRGYMTITFGDVVVATVYTGNAVTRSLVAVATAASENFDADFGSYEEDSQGYARTVLNDILAQAAEEAANAQ